MNFNWHSLQDMEKNVLAHHKESVWLLRHRVNDLIASSANRNQDNTKGLVALLQNQIYELEWNVNVFEKVKFRASSLHSLHRDTVKLFEQLRREIYRLQSCLPVFSRRLNIENLFNNATRIVIIQGETGSGKSTQIPQYVADHPKFIGKRIICTQPRKIAAVSLANRVAYEYNGGSSYTLGDEVGYHVGGVRRVGRNCRIEFVTEGVLLERIVNAAANTFENVGCIIIDEAHERSVTCDILLGYFKREDPRWKDILFVITSATIDLGLFANYFKGAPYLKIEGRTFPVDIKYEPPKENADIRDAVAHCALQIHMSLGTEPGDILCFLPGQEDVLYAQTMFETELAKCGALTDLLQAQAFALYGRMEPEQQAKVFERLSTLERKVVFSTDVSETSVTISGIVFVVDSGVKKEVVFDDVRNLSTLKVTKISKSSAIQRSGRCGRTQPGICYRVYSKEEFDKMEVNAAPEIHRRPISLAVLTLRGMKIDPSNFDWISAPSKYAIAAADKELRYLGAVDMENNLTNLGKLILTVQQDPKMVKMIYTGCENGFGDAAIKIASVMSVSNIVFWTGNDEATKLKAAQLRNEFSLPEGDIVTLFRVFEKWISIRTQAEDAQPESEICKDPFKYRKKAASQWCSENFINGKAMNLAFSTRRDLLGQFKQTAAWKSRDSQEAIPTNVDICRLACSGYFLNAARLILSKGSSNGASQYHAVHTDVIGKLDNKCALLNSPNKTELPPWIIYDKIFCPSVRTIFPITSSIETSWIEAECFEFHQLCMQKQRSLQTERLTKYISQECLRMIVGKRCAKIESFEQEWQCEIVADLETGRLELYCSELNKTNVEHAIENKVADAILDSANQVTEEDYLDGTRLVIGQGFEVKDVMFPQEYATVFIKNIPDHFSYADVKRLLTQENEELGGLDIVEQGSFLNAVAKFVTKKDAKRCFERISTMKEMSHMKIERKFGHRRQISQGLSTRLKLSWATEFSSGTANIDFHTADEANRCIENISNIFPTARVSRVHSATSKHQLNETVRSRYLFPPVLRLSIPYGLAGCRFRFDINGINLNASRELFIYKITVAGLPLDLDEQDIKEILKQYRVKWVKVVRGTKSLQPILELNAKEKEAKLLPLRKWKTNMTVHDFSEVNFRRAGMYIWFNGSNGNSYAKEAYNKADFSSLGFLCGQRHRFEIDYTHSVSINTTLLTFLEVEFNEFKLLAQEKGINVQTVSPKNNSRFTLLKFRTNRQSNILWIQEQLEAITSCTKFTDEKIALLFTWIGKLKMAVVAETGFVHWNNKNHDIWIYGNSTLQEEIIGAIKNIIDTLGSMEIIDKAVELDKKKFNGNEITKICERFDISCHHFFGCKLFVSGSKESVTNVEMYLNAKTLTRRNRIMRNVETRECGLCFSVPVGTFLVTILCGHLFCIECIAPLFEIKPAPPLPISCPTCSVPLALNDILKCASVEALRSILEVSVYDYQKEHSTDLRMCPRPDCSQILSYESRTGTDVGDDFLFCNICVTTYCVSCSDKLQKPIKSHEGFTCADVQSGMSSVVSKFVREIQENILNLRCPKCTTPFYDFTGCAAVNCATCNGYFCGLCLESCENDGIAHSHVQNCRRNPNKNYFVSKSTIIDVHRSMREQKIQEFVGAIRNTKIRNNVCLAIKKDLKDLGITEKFIASLLLDDNSADGNEDVEGQ